MKHMLIVSFLLLLFLNIFDGVSTYVLLSIGAATEANVSMVWMMNKLGVIPGMVVYKGIFIAILTFAIYKAIKHPDTLTKREHVFVFAGTVLLVGVYLYFMVTHNLQYLLEIA